jgi:hypothetical protein
MADLFDRLAARAFGDQHVVAPAHRTPFELPPDITLEASEALEPVQPDPAPARQWTQPTARRGPAPLPADPGRVRARAPAAGEIGPPPPVLPNTEMHHARIAAEPTPAPAEVPVGPVLAPAQVLTTQLQPVPAAHENPTLVPALIPQERGEAEPISSAEWQPATPAPARRTLEPVTPPPLTMPPPAAMDNPPPDLERTETTIRVSIGRIDVRAATPPSAEPARQPPARPGPRVSLDAYLERASARRRG